MNLSQRSLENTVSLDSFGQDGTCTVELLQEEIINWCRSYLAEVLELNVDDIDITHSFDSYGLDSSATVGMTGDLSEWLGYQVATEAPYDFPSIEKLARGLVADRELCAAAARVRTLKGTR
jgi:acyl carrier protein